MKMTTFLAMIGMVFPLLSHAHPTAEVERQTIYIYPSQLGFANGEMFAFVEGEWIPVDAIYSNTGGLLAAKRKDPNHSPWWCSICNYCNYGYSTTCKREYPDGTLCGNPRPW